MEAKNGQLQSLLEVTEAISRNLPASSLYHLYEAIAEGHLSVNILALFVYDEKWHKVVCINTEEVCEQVDIEGLLASYEETSELSDADKKKYPGVKFVIPVHHDQKPIAIAMTGTLTEGDDIPEKDALEFARTITSIIAVAVENQRLWEIEARKRALDAELGLASKIQNLLVPSKLPHNNLFEFAGFYSPHKHIGGDYYDVINISSDELVFCIADISGKGVAAALVMANLQAYLNAIENFNLEDPAFIRRLNGKVFSVTDGDKFITLFIAKYNIISRELTYINAGHNPPILMKDGQDYLLTKGCTIIGAMEEIPHVTFGKMQIPVGSTVLCYTDGLTELENDAGELFSAERLIKYTNENYRKRPAEFIDALNEELSAFKGDQGFNDDISVLTGKFL